MAVRPKDRQQEPLHPVRVLMLVAVLGIGAMTVATTRVDVTVLLVLVTMVVLVATLVLAGGAVEGDEARTDRPVRGPAALGWMTRHRAPPARESAVGTALSLLGALPSW